MHRYSCDSVSTKYQPNVRTHQLHTIPTIHVSSSKVLLSKFHQVTILLVQQIFDTIFFVISDFLHQINTAWQYICANCCVILYRHNRQVPISSSTMSWDKRFSQISTVHNTYDQAYFHALILQSIHWETMEPGGAPPEARSGHTFCSVGGRNILFGGCGRQNGKIYIHGKNYICSSGLGPSRRFIVVLVNISRKGLEHSPCGKNKNIPSPAIKFCATIYV